MSRFFKKLWRLRRRRQLDRDLEDELRFHLEMKAEEAGGDADAHLAARRRIGNTALLAEACRELWTFSRLETCWQDIRYALRTLAKTPGFTATAIVALGLGIGADTAIFTIVNGAFSWNMGLDHPDRVVILNLTDASGREEFGGSYPDFRDLRSQTKSLAGLAAYSFASVNLSDTKSLPERYACVSMSSNGFQVSEHKPAIGRDFGPGDERPGAPAVIILSDHVWRDRYGSDPQIPGKSIRVDDVERTVIGVMPPGKRFPEETDLWVPLVADARLEERSNRGLLLFGRLADGADTQSARAELSALGGRLAKEYPNTNKGLTVAVLPIAQITGAYNMRPLFAALWVAIGFVVLIACADVANMLLARGAGRVREISIRVAIGAGRGRILRQLLIESVVLALGGGMLGWLVALSGLRWFDAGTGGISKPIWLNLTLDTTAFTYLAVISIGTGILFGLAPALRLSRMDVHAALKDGGQGITRGRRVLSVSNLLVVLEMALCIVLLAGAGLMIRSTVNLYDAPLGVNPTNVLTMRVKLPEAKYPLPADEAAFERTLTARLKALPGVEATALVSNLPLGRWVDFAFQLEGSTSIEDRAPELGAIIASPDYFRVMQVQPRRGRTFNESDGLTGVPVVVVNESFAAKYWPGENAIGKHLRLIKDKKAQAWLTVAGIVPDVLQNFRRPLNHDPLIYLPNSEEPQREMFIVAKTNVPPATLAEAFRRVVRDLDENLPVFEVRTLEHRLAENRLTVSLLGGMFSVFAGIALVLAAVGLYAVIAHSITQRTQEIGVRMALGGTKRDILRLVMLEGMRPMLLGLAIGLPAALGTTHVLKMVLIGVSPGDPLTFCLVVLVLVLAGALGCAVPARRAIRVDPIVALRYE